MGTPMKGAVAAVKSSRTGDGKSAAPRAGKRKTVRLKDRRPADVEAERYCLHRGNVLDVYARWAAPDLIVSDGAYGVRGFRGDTVSAEGLVDWYAPHVAQWSKHAKPSTSLWFWNTEVGWATVHPLLEANGWEYVQLVTWDKGLSHIAGNVNGNTIRQFPVVTEVSALYRRKLTLPAENGGTMGVQDWLRAEWKRSGLPYCKANDACGVKNAATRKYLTGDWMWYWPPGDMVERMAEYAKAHGLPTNRPYFSIDGKTEITAERWDSLRAVWNHVNGVTNVWSRPPLHDSERLKGTLQRSAPRVYKPSRQSAAHLNQKPLDFMYRQVHAASNEGDVVWEPFGGLASASVAAVLSGRFAYVAETDEEFQNLALSRLAEAQDEYLGSGAASEMTVTSAGTGIAGRQSGVAEVSQPPEAGLAVVPAGGTAGLQRENGRTSASPALRGRRKSTRETSRETSGAAPGAVPSEAPGERRAA